MLITCNTFKKANYLLSLHGLTTILCCMERFRTYTNVRNKAKYVFLHRMKQQSLL